MIRWLVLLTWLCWGYAQYPCAPASSCCCTTSSCCEVTFCDCDGVDGVEPAPAPPQKELLALLSKLEVPSSPSRPVLVEGFEDPPRTGYEPLPQASARAPPAWA